MLASAVPNNLIARTMIAFGVFAVLAGSSIGILGAATASEPGLPGTKVAFDTLRIPAPRLGDRWAYVPSGPLADAEAREEGEGLTTTWSDWGSAALTLDRDGVARAAHVLRRAETTYESENWRFTSLTKVFIDQDTGVILSSQYEAVAERTPSDVTPLVPVWDTELHARFNLTSFPDADEVRPCDVPRPWTGALRVRGGFELPRCDGGYGIVEPTRMSWTGAYMMGGRTYAVFDRASGTQPGGEAVMERIVFRPDVPYPVQISLTVFDRDDLVGGIGLDLRLGRFEPGSAPLPSLSVRPALRLPPLEWADTQRTGPAGSPPGHPFPLSTAVSSAINDPESQTAIFLADHPGAVLSSSRLIVVRGDGPERYEWDFSWTDGPETQGDCRALRAQPVPRSGLLGEQVADPVFADSRCLHAAQDQIVESPSVRAPTAESLARTWAAYREVFGLPDTPISYGISYGDCPEACGRGGPRFHVGNMIERRSDAGYAMSPVREYKTVLEWVYLTFDSDGRLQEAGDGVMSRSYGGAALAPPRPFDTAAADADPEDPGWRFPAGNVAAAATVGALVLALLYWFFPSLKQVVGVGLFSRVTEDAALDNGSRAALMSAIAAEPGIHDRELQRRTGVARGALAHHLDKLMRTGLVSRQRAGGFTGYWPAGAADRFAARRAAALRSPLARSIAEAVRANPSISPTELATRFDCSRQAASHHLKRLRAATILP